MTPADHKAEILRHVLWMAKLEPDYAIWAAGEYERREPVLLKNLQVKVRQEANRERK